MPGFSDFLPDTPQVADRVAQTTLDQCADLVKGMYDHLIAELSQILDEVNERQLKVETYLQHGGVDKQKETDRQLKISVALQVISGGSSYGMGADLIDAARNILLEVLNGEPAGPQTQASERDGDGQVQSSQGSASGSVRQDMVGQAQAPERSSEIAPTAEGADPS